MFNMLFRRPDDPECQNKKGNFCIGYLPVLDYVLNFLILVLILALLIGIVYKLWELFFVDIASANIHNIINSILFILILIELFTILHSYLKKHFIKVERIVEVGIISLVREVIFHLNEMETSKIYAFSVLLFVFGILFFIEKYFSAQRNI